LQAQRVKGVFGCLLVLNKLALTNMANVKEIFNLMKKTSKKDLEFIDKAYNFAENAHKNHKRASGEPYFNHLFETAKLLAELNMDAVTVSAGLLHDSIEDVGVKEEDIKKIFGDEVFFLVNGVTKLGTIKYRDNKRHMESMRKLFVAMSQDIRVLMIKLADRLHNMRTLQYVKKEKQRRIAVETLEIYAPLAYRLGIRKFSRDLEDLSFQYVYPLEYEEIKTLVKKQNKKTLHRLEKFIKSLRKALAKENILNERVDYRIKGLYSLYNKLKRKKRGIEDVHDILAIRIYTETVGDCYKILGIVHGIWRPLHGRIKDYIAFPKTNGYQSLHTTIFTGDGSIIEVQIRTEKMHKNAEYGIASHILYKEEDEKVPQNYSVNWFKNLFPNILNLSGTSQTYSAINNGVPDWIKQLVDTQSGITENGEFLNTIKSDFFEERIFAFTPKGDVVDLPRGSSPIDFAYAIHSQIGNHTGAAKINGKMVSLSTKLKNGDIVEIITKESNHPTRKWLDMVKTSMAKKNIKSKI